MRNQGRLWSVFTAAVLAFCCGSATPLRALNPFTLEEILGGEFSATGFNGQWVTDDLILYKHTNGDLYYNNVTTGSSSVLADSDVLTKYGATGYSLSPTRTHLLISYDYEAGYRHSSKAKYLIYDLKTAQFLTVADGKPLQMCKWSPVDNSLIFVLDNDLYYRSAPTSSSEYQITKTGVPGVIYNGVPDWVYEEEVLGSGSASWISPDGSFVAFAVFNDTFVNETAYSHYGLPGSLEYQYPEIVKIRYPKAGTTNPTVSLKIADLKSSTSAFKIVNITAPVDIISKDHILAAVTWAPTNELAVTWMNRVQNISVISICNPINGSCTNVIQLIESKGWVDTMEPVFSKDGSYFVVIMPQPQGDYGNYKHVTLIDRSGQNVSLSSGTKVVTSILGIDHSRNKTYFLATAEARPSRRELYEVDNFDSSEALCVTCNFQNEAGGDCLYNSAIFSENFSHYMLACSGPDVPEYSIYRSSNHTRMSVWEDNQALRNKLASKLIPEEMDIDEIVPGGFKAKVRLLLPPTFKKNRLVSYPLIVYVYAGPDSNQISDSFGIDFSTYLVTNKSIIVALIDGRGSGLKGDDMLFAGYRNLGTVEIEDQINVTRALQKNYDFIDPNRTAIWGWSYGGYATAMSLAKDTEGVFKCGISVAPVTSWIYYDSIYTERYMSLPTKDDNEGGYNASDVTRLVKNFSNKTYYLIHGNADDNVHYQQSMMLSRQLERNDILFRQQSYPDENHGLGGVTKHLYHSMDKFWNDCLQPSSTVHKKKK